MLIVSLTANEMAADVSPDNTYLPYLTHIYRITYLFTYVEILLSETWKMYSCAPLTLSDHEIPCKIKLFFVMLHYNIFHQNACF